MIYPVPKHLRNLLVLDASDVGEYELRGEVRCPCGSEVFHPLYGAKRVVEKGQQFLKVVEMGGEWFCRIGAQCSSCEREHLLFDRHFHGWNGYVCTGDEVRRLPRPPSQVWICDRCGNKDHGINLSIQGEDIQTALAESGDALTKDNWFEAFGWITISVTCTKCGIATCIVDYETM